MIDLIFHSIACIGLCFILKYGSILAFIRNKLIKISYFNELFSCSLCLGFWSGAIIGLYSDFPIELFAVYGAAICWVADFSLDIIIKLGK